jgi:ketosteroid isomerase-like protein
MLDITTLAAWGEFLGGIAVVVSLIYLAGQIRQNSRLLRASTASATFSAQNESLAHMQSRVEWSCMGGNMIRIGVIAAVLLISGCSEPGARTAEESANLAVMQAMAEAYNAQEPDFVERFFSEDLVYKSYGPWAPQGMTRDREGLKLGMAFGMRVFPDRRTTVKSRVAEGDTVVEETEWVGTASDEHPTLQEGEREILRDITFYRFRDGKIVEIREYAVAVSAAPAQDPADEAAAPAD